MISYSYFLPCHLLRFSNDGVISLTCLKETRRWLGGQDLVYQVKRDTSLPNCLLASCLKVSLLTTNLTSCQVLYPCFNVNKGGVKDSLLASKTAWMDSHTLFWSLHPSLMFLNLWHYSHGWHMSWCVWLWTHSMNNSYHICYHHSSYCQYKPRILYCYNMLI